MSRRPLCYTIPNPSQFADKMHPVARAALLTAVETRLIGWSVVSQHVGHLRRLGLVDYRTTGLTSFGFSVRRELLRRLS